MRSLATTLTAWYAEHARDLPWRSHDRTAWGVLVSEIMLQQTPVARVIEPWHSWLRRWPTPAALAAAAPAEAIVAWANLGYPRRAQRLHRAATQIVARHDGHVPESVDDLLALSGVGEYTARAVAVFAFGQHHPVVDINTRRVLVRFTEGLAHPGPAARSDLDRMGALLPADPAQAAVVNAAAMELGALVCTARTPACARCPLAGGCAWLAAGRPATEDRRPKQARYQGSDRQVRGVVLGALRAASPAALAEAEVAGGWPDAVQRVRAIDSLIADGLIRRDAGRLALA